MIALNMEPDVDSFRALRLLHLEDSDIDHHLVRRVLELSGLQFTLARVESLGQFTAELMANSHDAILADYRLPGFTALDAWNLIVDRPDPIPFILVSGAIGESAAVEAVRLGISDYVAKDDLDRLPLVLQRCMDMDRIRRAKRLADAELKISQARLAALTEHLQASIEQERASISREIHDDIGGALAAIRFDLSWVERHTTDTATLSHLQSATDMLQHAVEASQRIMRNLRPAILEQGLIASVQWLTGSFSRRTGIPCVVNAPTLQANLDKEILLVAYRTAQEALTNIAKHANCHKVFVEISDAEDVLTLEIRDDGRGLSSEDRSKPQSFGLRGLQERARTVGGWLDISSRTGLGTSIILSVPLDRTPREIGDIAA